MRKIFAHLLFTALLLVSVTSCLLAQAATDSAKEDISRVFVREEVKPSFKGGNDSLDNYLTQTVNLADAENTENGMVKFIVSAKGNIYEVQRVFGDLSFEKSLENALLKSSGQWNSGLQNEHHITAYCILKISFHKKRIKAKIQ
ncbi:MAG: hypothetical protein ABI472_06560 [Ginsengibacter sp.]